MHRERSFLIEHKNEQTAGGQASAWPCGLGGGVDVLELASLFPGLVATFQVTFLTELF